MMLLNGATAERVIKYDISWYVPDQTLNIFQQKRILEHMVSEAATEISYIKRSFNTKYVTTGRHWAFQLRVQSGIDVPIFVLVDFMQREQFNQKQQKNDAFYWPTVVNAQCVMGNK